MRSELLKGGRTRTIPVMLGCEANKISKILRPWVGCFINCSGLNVITKLRNSDEDVVVMFPVLGYLRIY